MLEFRQKEKLDSFVEGFWGDCWWEFGCFLREIRQMPVFGGRFGLGEISGLQYLKPRVSLNLLPPSLYKTPLVNPFAFTIQLHY